MATLTELVETIAEAEGLDPTSVGLIARYIREAGLITTGGRGPSAARMDFSDAAHLLIGVNATKAAQDAAKIVSISRAQVVSILFARQIRLGQKIRGAR